ncbi:hypothetical protein PPL_12035 [Heterostelium album PN500]|uniref:RRM domain-containing protein n=1 Tax=Heterostelium pallidum (strain ATCC 26659 / Pp 5 / PN500) TaxID=670386 RepID=D3BLI2_HETP5|nr:hypothetical protein PPL_12035 [Heterostelium album PN500]EFA77433.1 hypothetical protein PPL_12035 [Heterostelium album PN500]|eukprot:XP_020429561.1 hypothetical protein PPL_12035 [Heterostelium album PN500]
MMASKENDYGVFVSDIARGVTDAMLKEEFSKIAEVAEAIVVKNKHSGETKGYGFVKFYSMADCCRAVDFPNPPAFRDSISVKITQANTNNTLYIGHLPKDLNEREIKMELEDISGCTIKTFEFDGPSKQYGWAHFKDHDTTIKAIKLIQKSKYTASLTKKSGNDDKLPSTKVLFARGIKSQDEGDVLRKQLGVNYALSGYDYSFMLYPEYYTPFAYPPPETLRRGSTSTHRGVGGSGYDYPSVKSVRNPMDPPYPYMVPPSAAAAAAMKGYERVSGQEDIIILLIMIKYKINNNIFVFLFLFIGLCFGASYKLHSDPLGMSSKIAIPVHHYFGEEEKESHKLWVFFNSKNYNKDGHQADQIDISHQNLQVASKLLDITERAIDRRSRRAQKIGLDIDDLPVQQSLVNAVEKCGRLDNNDYLSVHQRSKWMNSISVSIDVDIHDSEQHKEKLINQILSCITAMPFVEKIDLVRKFSMAPDTKSDFEQKELDEQLIMKADNVVDAGNWKQRRTLSTELEDFYNNTYNSIKQVNAVAAHDLGLDGNGLVILILDSGFLTSHEVFKNLSILATYDFINNATNVTSPFGDRQNIHGTATLSTIAGYNPGVMVGPAYKAHFLLAKTEDVSDERQQEEDYWVSGIEWGEAHGAELVSSSLGYTQWYKYYDMNGTYATITKAADKAVSKGMVVVSSAGNDGYKGIGAPADGINVISVGAIDSVGKATFFSSTGPSSDGRVKPDITALGLNNYVADAKCNVCYSHMSGTSFSCPLAAGSIALVMQKNPTWTPQQVYQAITATASQSTSPDIYKGYGILNTFDALNYAPSDSDCTVKGCSGHGGCCNGKCHCAPDRYGEFCEYQKVKCGADCINRGGTCAKDQYDFTYHCTHGLKSIEEIQSSCKICDGVFDVCGVCGGNGTCAGCDGIPHSKMVFDSCGVCGGDGVCKTAVVIDPNEEGSKGTATKIILGASLAMVATVVVVGAVIFFTRRHLAKRNQPQFISMTDASLSGDGLLFVETGATLLSNNNVLSNSTASIDEEEQ